ncbi:MBL fold metallo-hydrolase [Streptomyces sp. AP-93]|uniref:MBL fold metallo-hydrolase n=1 Tax=Streptomyces sp. AP-93 TaxID=2929048 RepID=UPI001FAF1C4B|nr:MBL fold metallo-hydrolase [Streptomyces sp. AP-93]
MARSRLQQGGRLLRDLGASGETGVGLEDTMWPLIGEGLVDLVATDHQVCDGVRLEAAPGHTPGQVAGVVESGEERAVITGDLVHHPVQFIEPDVPSLADADATVAAATRRAFVTRYADTGTLVIGTHFPAPTAGLLRRGGDGAVRFVADHRRRGVDFRQPFLLDPAERQP